MTLLAALLLASGAAVFVLAFRKSPEPAMAQTQTTWNRVSARRKPALLEAAGISSVVVAGGMEAWRAALLPTTRDNRDGVSYVSLLLKVRRPGKAEKTAHAAH